MGYNNYKSYVYLVVMWFIGCILGYFIIPDMPLLGAIVGGNSMITCVTFLEVYGVKH